MYAGPFVYIPDSLTRRVRPPFRLGEANSMGHGGFSSNPDDEDTTSGNPPSCCFELEDGSGHIVLEDGIGCIQPESCGCCFVLENLSGDIILEDGSGCLEPEDCV